MLHNMVKDNHRLKRITKNYELYLFILPGLVYFILFCYVPMYGVQIAFKDYNVVRGIWGSPWVGLLNLNYFFKSYFFWNTIGNTLTITLYSLAVGFPIPILLALMLNEVSGRRFKKTVQTVTYAPYFISTVVMVGMIIALLSPTTGIVNKLVNVLGMESVSFLTRNELFSSVYVWTGVWQYSGWGSIIYIAALAGIDPQLHESAVIDGATRLQRIRHINIPGILPTIVIMLILNTGNLMNVGFEKVFLMQNPLNLGASEVISTYVYKVGLQSAQYSFSSAVGLFNSVINFILLVSVNSLIKRINETSLW